MAQEIYIVSKEEKGSKINLTVNFLIESSNSATSITSPISNQGMLTRVENGEILEVTQTIPVNKSSTKNEIDTILRDHYNKINKIYSDKKKEESTISVGRFISIK